jgi:MtN3 and saliva related transmembrane protein
MSQPLYVELIGTIAALLTTLCWLPQTIRTIRTRDTASLSFSTFLVFVGGLIMWLIYGILIVSWPVIIANVCTLVLNLIILRQKLRHG